MTQGKSSKRHGFRRGWPRPGRQERRSLAAALLLAATSCGAGPAAKPSLDIAALVPRSGFTDFDVPVSITVTGLARDPLEIDLGGGRVTVPRPSHFELQSQKDRQSPPWAVDRGTADGSGALHTAFPAGLPAGQYTLVVTDSDGRSASLPDAFLSLGDDQVPPHFGMINPADNSTLQGGSVSTLEVEVDDEPGEVTDVTWTMQVAGASVDGAHAFELVGSRVESVAEAASDSGDPSAATQIWQVWKATFTVPVPPPDQITSPFGLVIVARDAPGNERRLPLTLMTAVEPTIVSFAPEEAGLGGDVLLTLDAKALLPGATVRIGYTQLLDPVALLDAAGAQTGIQGRVPPHGRAESLDLFLSSPAGLTKAPGKFTYLAPPRIRGIEPARGGPAGGGFRVTVKGTDLRQNVRLFVGSGPSDQRELWNLTTIPPNKVLACVPSGVGTLNVWAVDPVAGSSDPTAAHITYLDDAAAVLTADDLSACAGPGR